MNELALHTVELFSGVGMLGEGLRAGLRYLGFETRTLVHVEREGYAGSVLAARMAEGSLDEAPIWPDVCTFNAAALHGRVDCIVAGFPCQDLSVAGRRAGLDGKRSGLFFEVVRIATDSGAWLMLLENVAGIATATASVVDAEEGDLDERAAARVVGELADLGWDSEWITISASDVGASHGRARWFCLAWRAMDDAERSQCDGAGVHEGWRRKGTGAVGSARSGERADVRPLANASSQHGRELPRADKRGLLEPHGGLAEATPMEQPASLGRQERRPESARQQGRHDASVDGGAVANTDGPGQRAGRWCWSHCEQDQRSHAEQPGISLADASSPRLSQRVIGGGGAS